MLVLPIQYSWPIDLPMHPKKPGRPQETYQCNIEKLTTQFKINQSAQTAMARSPPRFNSEQICGSLRRNCGTKWTPHAEHSEGLSAAPDRLSSLKTPLHE
jgi:hypothetical protein